MGRTACTEPQCLYNGALELYLVYDKSGIREDAGNIMYGIRN